MKTIKTLLLLLTMTASAFAQLTTDDLLITGSVTDSTGGAMDNVEVCVTLGPNNITFPLDTICTTTDANGNYSIAILGGSASGPNVSFIVSMGDPCSNPINPTLQTTAVENGQGTVDTVVVSFVACVSANNSCTLEAEITSTVDSSGGTILTTLIIEPIGGTAPYAYFWNTGSDDVEITVSAIGVYCATVTDANGCTFDVCYTIENSNNGGNCNSLAFFSNSGLTPIGYTFTADVQDSDLYYSWEINNAYLGDGFEANAPGLSEGVHTICLTVVDSLSNCADTQCMTIVVGNQNCIGFVSGAAYAGSNNNPLNEGVVYLIAFDSTTNELSLIDSAVLDSSNFYSFGPLDCGDYLIKAAAYPGSPYYNNHIPTYFGNSPFWGLAQTVTLGQANTQVVANVTLIAANNPGGPGFIGGNVTEGANKVGPGDPVVGVEVVLFNLLGDAIAYAYTDDNGDFGFSNIAYGTYQVYVEVLGVQTIPAVVTIGVETPSVDDLVIFASETLITTGIEEFDFDGAISEIYPNPVLNEARIQVDFEIATQINVSVLDLTGRVIFTQPVSLSAGKNRVDVSVNQLKNGYYFLNIQDVDGVFSVTRKFMRID